MGIYTYEASGRLRGDEVLGTGIMVLDDETGELKIGDGVTAFRDLNPVPGFVAAEISDVAYDEDAWNGDSVHAPSKNVLRDKFESLSDTFALLATIDAKGDLLLGAASDTLTRLGVGLDQQMLVADSSATTGVKWAFLSALGYATNVKSFGAVGDGITDDTEAINDAFASLSTTGGTVYFPAGTYLVSDSLSLAKAGTSVVGAGRGVTTINFTASSKSIFQGLDDAVQYNHCGFEGINLNTTSSYTNVQGFDFSRLSYSWVRDCSATLRGSGSNGIWVAGADDGHGPYYCRVDNFYFSGGAQATNARIRFSRTGEPFNRTANSWLITGGRGSSCGIDIDLQGNQHVVIGGRGETISVAGVNCGNAAIPLSCLGCVIVGYGYENGSAPVVSFASTASGNWVLPGYATGAAADPYPDANGTNTVLTRHALTNSQTGTTYTPVLSDDGKIIECSNASAITFTIPNNSTVPYETNTVIEIFQVDDGQITFDDSLVTLNAPNGKKTAKKWATVSLRKRSTNTWVLSGDTTT